MIASARRHWLFVLAFVFVMIGWGICFRIAWLRANQGPEPSRMELYGQFGDTFGTVNALFTGLALVGVAYTVRLQIEQNRAQRDELEEVRQAQRLQAHEVYLSSRLNTTVALLHVKEAESNLVDISPIVKEEIGFDIRRLRAELSVLYFESTLGFDPRVPLDRLHKRAIGRHIIHITARLTKFSQQNKGTWLPGLRPLPSSV